MNFRTWFRKWIRSFYRLMMVGSRPHKTEKQRKKERERRLKAKYSASATLQKKKQRKLTTIINRDERIKTNPIIRLYYIGLEKFYRYADMSQPKIGQTYGISDHFQLPEGMTIEDACKVVSYLSDKVERENHLEPACKESVYAVSQLLNDYGFKRVTEEGSNPNLNRSLFFNMHAVSEYSPFYRISSPKSTLCNNVDGVVDLFSVGGDFKLFKKTHLHSRYFDWYEKDVSFSEIQSIYKNIGKESILANISQQSKIR